MKKALSFFLAVMLVFAALPLTVSYAAGTPEIKVAEVTAQRGDTVDVPVSFLNNPGINSYTLTISYDTTRLTLNSVTSNNAVGGSFNFGTKASWINSADTTYSGVFLTLHFTVLSTAPGGKANVSVSYNSGDICNYAEDDVDFTCTAGGVTVSPGTVPSITVSPSTLNVKVNEQATATVTTVPSGQSVGMSIGSISHCTVSKSGATVTVTGNSVGTDTVDFTMTYNGVKYTATLKINVTEPVGVYTLTYNANGGTGAPAKQTGSGWITLSAAKPTRSNYTFKNWNTKANGTGTSYNPGDRFNLTANTTLYAQWEQNDDDPKVRILQPTRTKIRYYDTLTLHAKVDNLPEGATIYWFIEDTDILHFADDQRTCNIDEHIRNRTCYTVTVNGNGKGTTSVLCVVCDADGNPLEFDGEYIYDSVDITSRYNFLMDIFFFIYVWFTKDYDM